MPTNLKLTPLTNRKSSMTTDIDMNEKVDTQKNVGNKRQTNLKLTPLTNRTSNMTTDIEYENYSRDTDIDTNECYSNVYTSVCTCPCFTLQNFITKKLQITKHRQQKSLHMSVIFFSEIPPWGFSAAIL